MWTCRASLDQPDGEEYAYALLGAVADGSTQLRAYSELTGAGSAAICLGQDVIDKFERQVLGQLTEMARGEHSSATVRNPRNRTPGVRGWASGPATTSNSAFSGAGPSRRRRAPPANPSHRPAATASPRS